LYRGWKLRKQPKPKSPKIAGNSVLGKGSVRG
jgi:hypothetical protein